MCFSTGFSSPCLLYVRHLIILKHCSTLTRRRFPVTVVYYGSRSYKENELEEELRAKYATNVTIATKNNQALSQFIRRSIGETHSTRRHMFEIYGMLYRNQRRA